MFEEKKIPRNWQKQLEKYSQNTSWFWQADEAFTPSGLSEMTSHTPVMPALPASAVWWIYRPLWALIHPSTHTQLKVKSDEWVQYEFKLTHRKTQHGYRIHPVTVTPRWSELETVWERHLSDRTQTEMFVWPCVYISIFMNLLWNGLKAHLFQLDEQLFQRTCQCNQ